MTKPTKRFAICPNGDKVTRTSKTRTYSHVVVARRSYAHDLACAERAGSSDVTASNFAYYRAYLDGTSKFLARKPWQSDADYAKAVAYDIARATEALAGCETLEAYRAHLRAEALDRVAERKASGYYDTFGVLGWSSRLDLAQKVAQAETSPRYDDVTILEAQIA